MGQVWNNFDLVRTNHSHSFHDGDDGGRFVTLSYVLGAGAVAVVIVLVIVLRIVSVVVATIRLKT